MTGHNENRHYFHRFKILDDAVRPWNEITLRREEECGQWKSVLDFKYLRYFIMFINAFDFDELS